MSAMVSSAVRRTCSLFASASWILLAGCTDNPLAGLLAEPALARAGLAISYSLAPGAQARVVQAPVDRARVQLSAAGAVAVDTTILLAEGEQETRVRLEVPMKEDRQTLQLVIELMAGETVVARAEDTVTLSRGEDNFSEVVANAVFAGVAAGRAHSCHLAADGRAFCWGSNSDGQLGDGTTTNRLTPVAVAGGLTFAQIDGGGNNTCALDTNGRPYCWGDSSSWGGVGDGTQTDRSTPTAVAGGLQFASVSVGAGHKCGLTSAGQAYCWGLNSQGQLGAATTELCGTVACSTTPVAVSGGHTFKQISVGFFQTCGLTTAGAAYCWGNNRWGQLGIGTTDVSVSTPTQISGGVQFVSLTGGSVHMCGLAGDGAAYCWGNNVTGQLGDGSTTSRSTPAAVAGGQRFRLLTSHAENSLLGTTCGTTAENAVYCWGVNGSGQVGVETTTTCGDWGPCVTSPTAVSGGLKFQTLDTGNQHVCGITTRGETYCWGNKGSGQLGNGSQAASLTPSAVAGTAVYTAVYPGKQSHTCALDEAGAASCWGANDSGQLGNGAFTSSNVPVLAQGGLAFRTLTAGASFNCAADYNQQVFCWGGNQYGQLGDGTTTRRNTPTAVTGGLLFMLLDASWWYMSAIEWTGNSNVYFWGRGDTQANDPQINSAPVFTGVTRVSQVEAGFSHTCYLDGAGSASCRGTNSYGELGDGTTTYSATAVPVQGGHVFRYLTAGSDHTCGITAEGTILCWGGNEAGQLGNGNTTNSSVPVAVTGGLTFKSVSAGNGYTCAVATDSQAYCWGYNVLGQLGDGTMANRSTPARVAGGHTWSSVKGGGFHTCGVAASGKTYCWGNSSSGQLGDGVAPFIATPTSVGGGASAGASNLTRMFARPGSGTRVAPAHPQIISETGSRPGVWNSR